MGHNPQIFTSVEPWGGPVKFLTGMTSGPKLTLKLSFMCCSELHITLTGGLADNGMNTLVKGWGNLPKVIEILKSSF